MNDTPIDCLICTLPAVPASAVCSMFHGFYTLQTTGEVALYPTQKGTLRTSSKDLLQKAPSRAVLGS